VPDRSTHWHGPVRISWPGRWANRGFTLIELMFAIGLIALLSALAVPRVLAGLDEVRARGAARYLAGRLQHTRMEAVVRSANAALRFVPAGSSFTYAAYLDGNRNGVRTIDIQRGIDRRLQQDEWLPQQFAGVDFGTLPDLPSVDESSPPPGADPIRIGSSNMVSFTAQGTATPGSLYVLGRRQAQFVVRIFGETGKTKVLRFDRRTRTWKPL
jgi:prepilin-type N-terminal cleavage/methylation domain-containing protein